MNKTIHCIQAFITCMYAKLLYVDFSVLRRDIRSGRYTVVLS